MKNKRNNDFHQFRVKILLRIIAMLGIAAAIIYITYSFLLRGNFANLMMSLLQNIGGMDYDRALELYSRVFRSHMDTIILLSILFACSTFFCIGLQDTLRKSAREWMPCSKIPQGKFRCPRN